MQFRDHLDRLSGRPRSSPRPASKIAITYTACPRNRQLRNSISSRSARHRTEFRRGGRRSELTAGLHRPVVLVKLFCRMADECVALVFHEEE
jgi:hypothetical protein